MIHVDSNQLVMRVINKAKILKGTKISIYIRGTTL